MAQLFQHQLQPFEENQSPSPSHEIGDPFGLAPTRSRSITRQNGTGASASGGASPVNTLHRQLSGDPDSPPPAWKRRDSFTQGQNASAAARSPSTSRSPRTSPTTETASARPNLPPSASARRPPNLQMTTSTPSSVPNGMFTHDSPNASSTSLSAMAYDPTFAPPQPAFLRKRGTGGGSGSNRSSIHSIDTSGMNSEDLWNLESSESVADLSNPQRNAMERPLDTVRRLSQRSERPKSLSAYSSPGLPVDLIWPSAPLVEDEPPKTRIKSKSTTNVSGLAPRQSRLGRRKTKTVDPQLVGTVVDAPLQRSESEIISSAHSSTTDLSKGIPPNKSHTSLGNRPPSTYYSRDFLSQLAPREGGYAIAAMLSSPTAQNPQSPPEDKRRSVIVGSRPPTSRSAGMGRWSLDGGEHYNRPYGSTSSANTTTSNLSAPPINSPEVSPPADDRASAVSSHLPEGASPPVSALASERSLATPVALASNAASTPNVPSPLSRSVTDDLQSSPAGASTADAAPIPVPPIPADLAASASSATPNRPALSPKKSKKELAKEAKAAEKAETAKLVAARLAKAREDTAKKAADKEKEKAAKEAAKLKEKEEKERKKAEKKNRNGQSGDRLKSPSQPSLSIGGLLRRNSEVVPVPATIPRAGARPVDQASSTATSATAVDMRSSPSSQVPTSKLPQGKGPAPPLATGATRHVSMPLSKTAPCSAATEPKKAKLGIFGTLRKRFSSMDTSSRSKISTAASSSAPAKAPPVPSPITTVTPIPAPGPTPKDESTPTPSTPKVMSRTLPPGAQTPTLERSQQPSIAPVTSDTPSRPRNDDQPRSTQVSATSPVTPGRSVPIQSEALPPRTTSIHTATPVATPTPVLAPAQGPASPSPSRTPVPPSSADSHSASISRSRSRSIQGPRPMPRAPSLSSRPEKSPSHAAPAQLETASGSEVSSGLSQVPSHLTSSTGTYDSQSQTPMTSEEAYSLGKPVEAVSREATPVGMAH